MKTKLTLVAMVIIAMFFSFVVIGAAYSGQFSGVTVAALCIALVASFIAGAVK